MSTGNLNKNSLSAKKNMRFEHGLIDAINDNKDDLIPFAAWVKAACKEKLFNDHGIDLDGKRTSTDTGAQAHKSKVNPVGVVNHSTGETPLNAKTNRDEIQALAIDLKAKGNTYKQIADYFNSLGYLTGTMRPFSRDSVTSLLRYTGNLENKSGIKL